MLKKIRKILIVNTLLLLGSNIAFADGTPFVGLGVGVDKGSWNLKNPAGNHTSMSAHGWNTQIFAGYGSTVGQRVYLGSEGFLGINTDKTSTTIIDNVGTTSKINSGFNFGISFIPGIKFGASSMVYGRAGVIRTNFKVKQTATSSGIVSGSTTSTATGGQLGLGLQTGLSTHVDLRGEYTYTSYQKISAFGNKISPHTNEFNLGLLYKID